MYSLGKCGILVEIFSVNKTPQHIVTERHRFGSQKDLGLILRSTAFQLYVLGQVVQLLRSQVPHLQRVEGETSLPRGHEEQRSQGPGCQFSLSSLSISFSLLPSQKALVIYKIKFKFHSACLRSFTFCLSSTHLSFEPHFHPFSPKESTFGTYLSLNHIFYQSFQICTCGSTHASSPPVISMPCSTSFKYLFCITSSVFLQGTEPSRFNHGA